jgi:hypothetical protein
MRQQFLGGFAHSVWGDRAQRAIFRDLPPCWGNTVDSARDRNENFRAATFLNGLKEMKSSKNICFKELPKARDGITFMISASEMKNVIWFRVVYYRE